MNTRLSIVIALICLPGLVAAVEAVRYFSANRSTNTMVSMGVIREYSLHVPPGYDPHRPAPLVITLHGAAIWPAAQQRLSQWDRVADREGFIVAYPSGRTGNGPRHFDMEDATFIADLVDEIQRSYNIDRTRIYANGLSNGGGMSFILSCTMPDRIAAVGLVASAQLWPWSVCRDDRPVPMIAFHGTDDNAAPYVGGQSPQSWIVARPFPSIPAWTANWGRRNQCDPTPVESRVAPDVTTLEYVNCTSHASAILYTIHGGGHTWPGGRDLPEWYVGKTTHTIDAASLMWDFFKAHSLQR